MLTMEPTAPTRYTAGDEANRIFNEHRRSIEDYTEVTELEREFPTLARHLGAQALYLVTAADNEAGTFKARGAMVGVEMAARQGAKAMYGFSAGNHARGLVVAARAADMELRIGVPTTAPPAKSEQGLRELWDSPKLHVYQVGDTLEQTRDWMTAQPGFGKLVHPFDDPDVIAGQGTIADSVLDSAIGDDIRHIVLPIGGGGLAAGMVNRLNERGRHDVTVHAIEGSGNDSASRSLRRHEITDATGPNKRYGGAAVKRMGQLAFQTLGMAPNFRVHSVSDEAVTAVTELYAQDRADYLRESTPHYEPTTLVAVAGLARVARLHPGEPTAVVGTGYNDSLWVQAT